MSALSFNDPRIQGQGAATDWFSQQGAPVAVNDGPAPGSRWAGQHPYDPSQQGAPTGGGWNGPMPGDPVPAGYDTSLPFGYDTGPYAWGQQGAPTGGSVLTTGNDFFQNEQGGYTGPDIAGGGYTGLGPQATPWSAPAAGGAAPPPGGQTYQQIVESLMGGSNDPNRLREIAPQLAQYGITLSTPNASGDLSKILLPDGTPIRVIGAGEGHAVWNPQPGTWGPGGVPQGGQSGGQSGLSPLGALAGGLDPSAAGRLGYSGGLGLGDPTMEPGYQFGRREGLQALDRIAAAKGTLLTGGTLRAAERFGNDYATTKYGDAYNRMLGENQAAYGRLFGEQVNRGNQLLGLSQIGSNAAGQQANLGSAYAGQAGNILGGQATNIGNLVTGAGNAASAGTIAQGNAWAQGLQGVGQGANNALQMYYLSKLYGQQPPVMSAG